MYDKWNSLLLCSIHVLSFVTFRTKDKQKYGSGSPNLTHASGQVRLGIIASDSIRTAVVFPLVDNKRLHEDSGIMLSFCKVRFILESEEQMSCASLHRR